LVVKKVYKKGAYPVMRGVGWRYYVSGLRTATRTGIVSSYQSDNVGVRSIKEVVIEKSV
jgi:formylglycine-generating enzyme required for sulfatase activity